jgi:hypothetical protein
MDRLVDEMIVQNDEQSLFVHMCLYPPSENQKKNWLATAIVAASHPRIIKMLCSGVKIDPHIDDMLYLCAKHQNQDAFCVIISFAIVEQGYIEGLLDAGSVLSSDLCKWDLWDPTNPRNVNYAISDEDIPRIRHLVQNGCDLTYWCSYCLRYALIKVKKEGRQDFVEICKLLMQNGASMKAVVYDKAFREKIDSKLSRWLVEDGKIEITLS